MRRLRQLLVVAVVLAAAVPQARAFDYAGYKFDVGARALAWYPSVMGDIQFDLRTTPRIYGTQMYLEEDLGVGDQMVFGGEGFIGIGKHRTTLRYMPFKYTSDHTLIRDLVSHNVLFKAGTPVHHTLEWEQTDFEYRYRAKEWKKLFSGLSLDALGRFRHIEGTDRLLDAASSAGPKMAQPSFSRWVPMLGGGMEARFLDGHLACRGYGAYMQYPENRTFELNAEVAGKIWLVSAELGYKWNVLDVEIGESYLDLELTGPYVSLTFEF
jgi:hypothetical protein